MKWGLVTASLLVACSGTSGGSPDANRADAADVDAPATDAPIVDATDAADLDATTCPAPPACPAPSAGKLSLCGDLRDAELDAPIALAGGDGSACDPAQPTASGPCSLRLVVADAIAYAQDPIGTPPLAVGTQSIDTCGRYVLHDVTPPANGFAAIIVDDHQAVSDAYAPTLVVVPGTAGNAVTWLAYATQRTSEQAWSTSASLSPGFAERGALLLTFRNDFGQTQVLREGSEIPDDDFYFSDATLQRTTISTTLTATGASGSLLVIDGASPSEYSGTGPCTWYAATAASIPGHLSVHDILPRTCP